MKKSIFLFLLLTPLLTLSPLCFAKSVVWRSAVASQQAYQFFISNCASCTTPIRAFEASPSHQSEIENQATDEEQLLKIKHSPLNSQTKELLISLLDKKLLNNGDSHEDTLSLLGLFENDLENQMIFNSTFQKVRQKIERIAKLNDQKILSTLRQLRSMPGFEEAKFLINGREVKNGQSNSMLDVPLQFAIISNSTRILTFWGYFSHFQIWLSHLTPEINQNCPSNLKNSESNSSKIIFFNDKCIENQDLIAPLPLSNLSESTVTTIKEKQNSWIWPLTLGAIALGVYLHDKKIVFKTSFH